MPSNFRKDDPIFGTVDLDDAYITDAWLVDQFVGNQLFTWGNNSSGQLGYTIFSAESPVQVGSSTTWSQISVGQRSVGTIKTDGTFWTWGSNIGGVLGINSTANRSSPVQLGSSTTWNLVSVGSYSVIARTS